MYHAVLIRQLKKFFPDQKVPTSLKPLLEAVSDTYTHADEDRKLLERSINISSKEMSETNANLLKEKERLENQATQLETANKVMINRELKMIELKKMIEQLSLQKAPSPNSHQ